MADVDEAPVVPLHLIHRKCQIMELILLQTHPSTQVLWGLGQILEKKINEETWKIQCV